MLQYSQQKSVSHEDFQPASIFFSPSNLVEENKKAFLVLYIFIYHSVSLSSFTKYLLNDYCGWDTALSTRLVMLTRISIVPASSELTAWEREVKIKSAIQILYIQYPSLPAGHSLFSSLLPNSSDIILFRQSHQRNFH